MLTSTTRRKFPMQFPKVVIPVCQTTAKVGIHCGGPTLRHKTLQASGFMRSTIVVPLMYPRIREDDSLWETYD